MTVEDEAGVGAGSPLRRNGGSVVGFGVAVAERTGRAFVAGGESAAGCQLVKGGQWGTGRSSLAPAWCGGSGLVPVKPPGDSLVGSHDPSGTPEPLAAQLALPGSAVPPVPPALFGSFPGW